VDEWVEEIGRLGLTVLINEHRVLHHGTSRVLLAGITDHRAGQFKRSHAPDPETAMSGAQPCHLKILLAHQPRSIYDAARSGFDLQISGHTHGGQFFPWNFFVSAVGQPYVADLHKYKNTWIYVSRGTGYWGPPLRLGAKSEITLIKLTRA
jgi:predicted MPP superfamily phosphohydrolase